MRLNVFFLVESSKYINDNEIVFYNVVEPKLILMSSQGMNCSSILLKKLCWLHYLKCTRCMIYWIVSTAERHIVKSFQEVFRTVYSFVSALFRRAMIINVNRMAPTTISFDFWFLGFVKLGITPGGGDKADNWRTAGSCSAGPGICWDMVPAREFRVFGKVADWEMLNTRRKGSTIVPKLVDFLGFSVRVRIFCCPSLFAPQVHMLLLSTGLQRPQRRWQLWHSSRHLRQPCRQSPPSSLFPSSPMGGSHGTCSLINFHHAKSSVSRSIAGVFQLRLHPQYISPSSGPQLQNINTDYLYRPPQHPTLHPPLPPNIRIAPR